MSRKILQYSSIGNMVDGTNYCSGVETLGDNLIEENEDDAFIVFPSKDSWVSPRTSDYVITDLNCEIHLPLPIYKIKRVLLKSNCIKIQGISLSDFKLYDMDSGDYVNPQESFPDFDVTEYFVLSDTWNALPKASSTEDATTGELRKENTISYAQGDSIIKIPGDTQKYGGGLLFSDEKMCWELFLYHVLIKHTKPYKNGDKYYAYRYQEQNQSIPAAYYYADEYTGLAYESPQTWQFRIEYVPIASKTKIRARKNAPTTVDYIQPFNQRAEINAVSALGKNMYFTAQKTGVREIAIVKNYTKLADVPPLGALVWHNGKRYRLVANTYKQTNTIFMQVTHTLSENWTSRSKHIAVDQKYRNWKIPQDNVLWRNLYWEDYVVISPELNADVMYQEETAKASVALSRIMQGLMLDCANDATVDTMFFVQNSTVAIPPVMAGAFTPCSTMVVGNSIVFVGSMQDNLSAGLRRKQDDNNLCEEVLYCNKDGTLSDMTILLSDGVCSKNDELSSEELEERANSAMPAVNAIGYIDDEGTFQGVMINGPKKVLMHNDFHVDKDPGEALKFTYQVHFVSDGGIIVGSKLAEHNPLIKHWGKNRQFRLWGLKEPIGDGVDVFIPRDDEPSWTKVGDNEGELSNTFTVTDRTQDLDGKEVFVLSIDNALTGCIGWCITDENNNIYLACNDKTVTQVYFQMTHKRIQK